MANVKFLMGDLADLPNKKIEGQVYFTYKNVGSADNPNYVGALYLDKNNSVRIKMTANADIAEKDSAGNTITSTYIKNISISGTTITVTRGDNKTFTLSTQDNNNKVTQSYVAAADYTNWRTIPWGASNSGTEGFTPSTVTDGLYTTTTLSFQPSTGTVRATKFKGALIGNADTATSAGKATNDAKGQAITSTYIKNASISSNGTSNTLTFTKGDNKTFTVTIPAATDSLAGLITNGEQTFSGTKTFNNTINLVNDKTGINWSRVTDGASILFYAETDATDNYLDFHVTDDENVNFRWTKTVGSENLILGTWKREGIRLGLGKFIGDLTGNAATATKLQTAHSINGTNFDGTGNITTTNWGTSRTLTIGNTGKSVNGGSNVSWSLSEIGASAIGHTHNYAGSASVGGAAISANKLNTNAGSGTRPVYFSGGVPVQCNDVLANSISGNAATATSVVDYNYTSARINIGYNGSGISGEQIKYIAGYTNGTNGASMNIKDISKDALKAWLGLGSLAYSSATIPTIPSSLPANGGNASTVNGHTVNTDVPANAKFTDTWRPLGTTADTACAGNDSRLSNARPASDVYAWAKASTKPSYSWGEITGKPTAFTPESHTHNKIIRSTHLNTIDALNAFKEANAFKYATVSALSGLIGLAQNDGIILSMTWKDSTAYGHQIFIDDSGYTIAHRYNGNNTWSSWSTILDSSNYTSYTVSKTGSGASGTWDINVSGSSASCLGNAKTATKLLAAKWITVQDSTGACKGANTAFDGSASIALSMPPKGKFEDGLWLGNGSTSDATKNSIEFYTTSTTSAGAKIVAYSDRIEFVFA